MGSNPIEVAWIMARYANRQSGEAQTFVTAGSTPACATGTTCVGWASASPSDCKSLATGFVGSTPARRTDERGPFFYRFRMPAPHAGEAGSIPARAAQATRPCGGMADTRRSERRARRAWEFDSPLGHLYIAGAAGAQLAPIRPVCPVRYRGLQLRVGVGSTGSGTDRRLVSLDRRVQLPDPPRPGTQIGIAARSRASCLWVQVPPRSLKERSRGPRAKTPG